MLAEPGSSTSGGGVAALLRLPNRFLFYVSGGSGPNLTSGMNGACSTSSATMVDGGTNAEISSIMGVGEGILMNDSEMMLLLDIEMNILCEESPQILQLYTK